MTTPTLSRVRTPSVPQPPPGRYPRTTVYFVAWWSVVLLLLLTLGR